MSGTLPPLSPHRREVLLDALRPPSGYRLDCAVGTSYSLDVMSALLVPMAFAMFDSEDEGDDPNPVTVLAALRSYASQVDIYFEQGRLAPAARAPAVVSYLESSLKPVRPPADGAFHPKVWVVRFAANETDHLLHRVLCLSRNLTFDRSWDTVTRLEESGEGSNQAQPLVRFLRYLNSQGSSDNATSLAATLQGVSFAAPRGFDRIEFNPMVAGDTDDPVGSGSSLLVVSPFLGSGRLENLLDRWDRVSLVSRGESLDRVEPELLRRFRDVFAFDSLEHEGDSELSAREELVPPGRLSGLHAKIHSGTSESGSFLLVGSANSTSAAFQRNIEFGVRLQTRTSKAAPNELLRDRSDRAGLRALLREYTIKDEQSEPTDEELELERLDCIRREIADLDLTLECRKRSDESFDLKLGSDCPLPTLQQGDRLRAWPITLNESAAVEVRRKGRSLANWNVGSAVNVTGLIAFELKGKRGVPPVRFTLTAKVVGDAGDRLDLILAETLNSPERLLRFLLLLLAAGSDEAGEWDNEPNGAGSGSPPGASFVIDVPLLESLLKTFAREPGRLRTFQRVLTAIKSSEGEQWELPEGLMKVWEPIEEALGHGPKR